MADYTIPADQIDAAALRKLYDALAAIVAAGAGKIEIAAMLTMLNFDDAVRDRITKARGPIDIKCAGGTCTGRNDGTRVEEDIPGMGGTLGIIIHEKFRCTVDVDRGSSTVTIDDIEGLDADIPGPFNPDVDRVVVKLPKNVTLTV